MYWTWVSEFVKQAGRFFFLYPYVTMLVLVYYRASGSTEFGTFDRRLVFIKFCQKTIVET